MFILHSQCFHNIFIHIKVFPFLFCFDIGLVDLLSLFQWVFLVFLRVHSKLLLLVDLNVQISFLQMQKQAQYQQYRLGLVCPHGIVKSAANYLDVACSKHMDTYHRISQSGKICNKCATTIMHSMNSLDECPCCSDSLQVLVTETWICSHSNRSYDQITIKCLDNQNDIHQVPFKQKICKACNDKVRAAFMFSNSCAVCIDKQSQVFENIEKTITKPSFYFFEEVIKKLKGKPDEHLKKQFEHYCLAQPKSRDFKSQLSAELDQLGENTEENHQSKRYQLFPKCPKHRDFPISLCNNCLVSTLNLKTCPYGCLYESKEIKLAKTQAPKIHQSGFICFYPKQIKDSQYLQYFCIRHIEESSKIDKWQGALRKVKYSGKQNIIDKFALYAASIQVGKSSFLMCGGVLGSHISSMKTISQSFLINITESCKNFNIEELTQMNDPRQSHSIVLLKDSVYVVGGYCVELKKPINDCQKFNMSSRKWERIAKLKVERSKCSILQHKGSIYVFGGISFNQQIWQSSCQMYNPQKDHWQPLPYKGFDNPYTTGSSFVNGCWGLQFLQNIFILGGSNYETSTYFMQEMDFVETGFQLNYLNEDVKLAFTRVNGSLSVMKTENPNQKIILVFGGTAEHQSLLSFDAIRTKISNHKIQPAFVYEEVPIGSYKFMLRQNSTHVYNYMAQKLTKQGLLSKDKLDHKEQNLLRSEESLHKIQKMWYGVGKCILGYSL